MTSRSIIIAIQFIALAVLFINLLFVIRQESSAMQNYLIVLLMTTIIMFVGYIMEIRARSLEAAELAAALSYLGKPFVMLYSAMFICSFYGFKVNKKLFYLLNILCGGIFALVYTNDLHHLYYGTTAYDSSLAYSPLIVTHGRLYFIYILTTAFFFASCLILIIKGYLKNKSTENRKIALLMSLMIVSGVLGYLAFLINLIDGYDTTLLGVLGSVLCLSVMFFKYRIFDVLSFAKNEALMDSNIGLIVLDPNATLLYANHVGSNLISKIGLNKLKEIKEQGENIPLGKRIYFARTKYIYIKQRCYGRSIEISDITAAYNYQQKLEKEVEERTQEVESIQRSIIGSLASIVEARSSETGKHIIRTREYVEKTAFALREKGLYNDILTDSYIALLADVAPLHDIGKITISDLILNKPGKLTKEEFDIIKKHTTEGSRVIEETMRGVEKDEYVELASEIALNHHEKYDGSGYPSALKGNDIPLSARIVALADSYDALISPRVYKPAFSKEEALAIIKEETGSHFDPQIAETFISII